MNTGKKYKAVGSLLSLEIFWRRNSLLGYENEEF